MSLLALLQEAQGGQGVAAIADRLGLDRGQADRLAEMLAPAIGSAVKKRAEAGGADRVAHQLRGEGQAGFFDEPARAGDEDGRAQGAAFLDDLLGSAEAREGLAGAAAERAGVDSSTAQQFLPALAAMLQGGLQRRMPDSQLDALTGGGGGGLMGLVGGLLGGGGRGAQGGAMGMLTGLLDRDNDGSMLDDVLEGFLRR